MRAFFFALSGAALLVAACGGNDPKLLSAADDAGVTPDPVPVDDAGGNVDATRPPAPPTDAGQDTAPAVPGIDASYPPDPVDGTPTRQACTSTFGAGLSTAHGRLDGTLVALVPATTHGCNGDSSHLHLQILMSGSVYDVATNLDTLYAERDIAIPGGAWQEGWHAPESFDYPTIGLHSGEFVLPPSPQVMRSILESALANANHVAIFATGYGPDGIHDVHRRGGGLDGAIVIDPLATRSHVFFFRFDTDTF